MNVTSTSALRSPGWRARARIVAVTSAAPAPEDRSSSPTLRQKSRVRFTSRTSTVEGCQAPRRGRPPAWEGVSVRIDFHPSPEPTLGVEWELALVDRHTRDLSNDAAHLFARAKARMPDPGRLHQELLRNTVELVTGVCHTVGEAMDDLRRSLAPVVHACDDL